MIGGSEFKLSLEDSDVVVGNMGGTEGQYYSLHCVSRAHELIALQLFLLIPW